MFQAETNLLKQLPQSHPDQLVMPVGREKFLHHREGSNIDKGNVNVSKESYNPSSSMILVNSVVSLKLISIFPFRPLRLMATLALK